LLAVSNGCDEDITVEPPPPPPQISTVRSWSKTFDKDGKQDGLQNNDVFAFLEVSDGTLWIGNQLGIAIYPNTSTTKRSRALDQNNGLPNPKVRDLVEHAGNIYVATWGGGIGVYNIAGDTTTTLSTSNSGLINDLVGDLELFGDDIYCATNNGISIYNTVAGTFTQFPALLSPIVSAIAVVVRGTPSDTERWYTPKTEFGLQPDEFDDFGITVKRSALPLPIYYTMNNSGLPEPSVNAIHYDAASDRFWLAFPTMGLAEVDVDGSTWKYYTTEDGLPSNIVYSITEVGGRLWVGTQNGIAGRRSNGSFQGYNRSGGIRSDRVRRVQAASNGQLWLGFIEAGASLVNPATAEGL